MNAFHQLAINLDMNNREFLIPLEEENKFFVVDENDVRKFLELSLELKEQQMQFSNIVSSQPYSYSLDKATIVNSSNGTVMQQESFSKSTTDSFTFTNTKGYTKGGSVSATIGTTLLGGVGTSLNASFNLSQNASTTASQTQQRSQQQTITVPAKTALSATWIIKNVDISADYVLNLSTAPRPVINASAVPGSVRTAEPPILPVYKYIHDTMEAFKYLPSVKLDMPEWHLASVEPVFYFVPNAANAQGAHHAVEGGHKHWGWGGRNSSEKIQKAVVAAPAASTSTAVIGANNRRGSKGWFGRDGSKHESDKDLEVIKNNVLVPLFAIPSASNSDQIMYSTVDQTNRQMTPTFTINSQNIPGTVALWRYRSTDMNMPRYRLEADPFAKVIPGWVNEGIIGFVHSAVPTWKTIPEDSTTHTRHVHPLIEKTQEKKTHKCSKCAKRVAANEAFYKCEECKGYVNCSQCYNQATTYAEEIVKFAVSRFHEMFIAVPDKVKQLSVAGSMQGTQGTHTYITIDPITEEEAEEQKKEMDDIQGKGKGKGKDKKDEKKGKKSKKDDDEDEEEEEELEEAEEVVDDDEEEEAKNKKGSKAKSAIAAASRPANRMLTAGKPAPPPVSAKPASLKSAPAPLKSALKPTERHSLPASHHTPSGRNTGSNGAHNQFIPPPPPLPEDDQDSEEDGSYTNTNTNTHSQGYSDAEEEDDDELNQDPTPSQAKRNNKTMAQMYSLSSIPIPPPPPPPPAFTDFGGGFGGGMMAPTNISEMQNMYNPTGNFIANPQPIFAPQPTAPTYAAPVYTTPSGQTSNIQMPSYNLYTYAQQSANAHALNHKAQGAPVAAAPATAAPAETEKEKHVRFARFRRNKGDPGMPHP